MKTFIFTIIFTVFMLLSFAGYIMYLDDVTNKMEENISQISKEAKNKEWEKCKILSKKLVEEWKKNETILCVFTDHGDLDEVKRAVMELDKSVEYEEEKDVITSSSVLSVLIDRLKENEFPKFENILKTDTKIDYGHNML